MAKLILKKLNKAYAEQEVLKDISAEIPAGSFAVVTGESGIGKTTLLRLLMGLEVCNSGEIIFEGGKTISAVFQENRLLPEFSAYQNVKAVCPLRKKAEILEALAKLIPDADFLKSPVENFSGGMQRRVAIVRAMLADSDLILMDEPFSGLDAENKEKALAFIKEEQKGRSVIFALHAAKGIAWDLEIHL